MCTSLVRFKFSTDCSNGPSMPAIPPVAIPNLKSLDWQGMDVDDVNIFGPLVLPSLTSLEMRDGIEDSVFLLGSHSSFALQKLTLVFFALSFTRFSVFLRNMPSLTSFELRMSITITDELLAFLKYDSRNPVLPQLARLVLCCHEQHFSELSMVCMVQSRWGPRTPLKYIRISAKPTTSHASTPTVHRKVFSRIATMVAEGLYFDYKLS
ncbi:hypothetical protein B0H17DRAFT_1338606 [Mycena rosella]|uniref:Uncharacterized protein n=1 Tax=Mycena rosella TaxID=1033263 RepID=A0AAD7CLQ3_MYCRO|nr:hypothetical protein B0H17DRAFT_1338606 [Mycena rosella]